MNVECKRCGAMVDNRDAKIDYKTNMWLCPDCYDKIKMDELPEFYPPVITVEKRICKAKNGYHFLTSSYPNRSKDGNSFYAMDGLYQKGLLPGLRINECTTKGGQAQGIDVNVHISRFPMDGYVQMYVFGYKPESRLLTPCAPEKVRRYKGGTRAVVKNGSMYVDTWCKRDYFPDQPEGAIFPVYVKVERK